MLVNRNVGVIKSSCLDFSLQPVRRCQPSYGTTNAKIRINLLATVTECGALASWQTEDDRATAGNNFRRRRSDARVSVDVVGVPWVCAN